MHEDCPLSGAGKLKAGDKTACGCHDCCMAMSQRSGRGCIHDWTEYQTCPIYVPTAEIARLTEELAACRVRESHCAVCGEDGRKYPIEAHHRDGNKGRNGKDNVVNLCDKCHFILHQEANLSRGRTARNQYNRKLTQEIVRLTEELRQEREHGDGLADVLESAGAWLEAIVTDGTLPESRPDIVARSGVALAAHEARRKGE